MRYHRSGSSLVIDNHYPHPMSAENRLTVPEEPGDELKASARF
jgi:hypothetical protein